MLFRFLILCALVLAPIASAKPKRRPGYPNYFVPLKYQQSNPEEIPDSVLEKSRKILISVINQQLNAIEVPLVLDPKKGPERVSYFDFLEQEARKIDPQVELNPSAGVIRTLLAYNAEKMHDHFKGKPSPDSLQYLEELGRTAVHLPGYELRGLGADFDLWIRVNKEPKTETFRAIQEALTRLTTTTQQYYGLDSGITDEALGRMLFPKIDIRPLETIGIGRDSESQVDRSVKQGGSSLDWISFRRQTPQQAADFLEPNEHPYILQDFLRGQYRYLPPQEGVFVEDLDKQTIRGFRPLTEFGYLQLLDDDQLQREILQISGRDLQKEPLSEAAEDIFGRIRRNSRVGGWGNRIHSGPKDSVESAVATLVNQVGRLDSRSRQPAIPFYVESYPIPKEGRPLNGLPSHLLTPPDEFIRTYAKDGVLYHGTPSVADSLSLLRNGMFAMQSNGAFRQGGYLSPNRKYALGYAGSAGPVIERRLIPAGYHVLDVRKHAEDPWILQAIDRASSRVPKIQVADLLSEEHGIDFFILDDDEVVTRNVKAFEPTRFADITRAYATLLENHWAPAEARLNATQVYPMLHAYSKSTGEEIPAPIKREHMEETLFKSAENHEDADLRVETLLTLRSHLGKSERLTRLVNKALSEVPLEKIKPLVENNIPEALTHSKRAVQELAIDYLAEKHNPFGMYVPEMKLVQGALLQIALDDRRPSSGSAANLLFPSTLRSLPVKSQRKLLRQFTLKGIRDYTNALSAGQGSLTKTESEILPERAFHFFDPHSKESTGVFMQLGRMEDHPKSLEIYFRAIIAEAEATGSKKPFSGLGIAQYLKNHPDRPLSERDSFISQAMTIRGVSDSISDLIITPALSELSLATFKDLLSHPDSLVRKHAWRSARVHSREAPRKAQEVLKFMATPRGKAEGMEAEVFELTKALGRFFSADPTLMEKVESLVLKQSSLSPSYRSLFVDLLKAYGRTSEALESLRSRLDREPLLKMRTQMYKKMMLEAPYAEQDLHRDWKHDPAFQRALMERMYTEPQNFRLVLNVEEVDEKAFPHLASLIDSGGLAFKQRVWKRLGVSVRKGQHPDRVRATLPFLFSPSFFKDNPYQGARLQVMWIRKVLSAGYDFPELRKAIDQAAFRSPILRRALLPAGSTFASEYSSGLKAHAPLCGDIVDKLRPQKKQP